MKKYLVICGHKGDMWFVAERTTYQATPTQGIREKTLIRSVHYNREDADRELINKKRKYVLTL